MTGPALCDSGAWAPAEGEGVLLLAPRHCLSSRTCTVTWGSLKAAWVQGLELGKST